jgi:ATP-binding cassette subfamily B protein
VLKDVSFHIPAHSRTAILGPTAAGKTQIFYLLAGLLVPTSGEIRIDGVPLNDYTRKSHSDQIGLVFQDSSLFNTSIMENINFKNVEDEADIGKAIETAELKDFIAALPQGLDTMVAERGTSLSGGQKQRITLARALVLNPRVLLLDDFTARVDKDTERKIFVNLKKNYGGITQVLITQQISSVMDFDKIILIMEGEILAEGTHEELLRTSVEYELIYKSQMSMS